MFVKFNLCLYYRKRKLKICSFIDLVQTIIEMIGVQEVLLVFPLHLPVHHHYVCMMTMTKMPRIITVQFVVIQKMVN